MSGWTRRRGARGGVFAPLAVAVSFAVAASALTAPAEAQLLRIDPLVLLDGDPTFGVRLTSAFSRERDRIGPYPRSLHAAWKVEAPLLWEWERNAETLRARVDGGYLLSLFRPAEAGPGGPSVDDEPWNLGWIAVQATVGAEAPQRLGTADLTLGGSLQYGHEQYHRLWFLPETRIGWDAVFCVECDPLTSDEDETGSRWNAELSWSIPADRSWMPSPLRPLWLRLRGRAFTASGLDAVAPARNEDGLWGSAELAYRCDACGPIHEIYVRGHNGRLPIELREERAVTAGVSLAF